MDVRECLLCLLLRSGPSYWLNHNFIFAILNKLLSNKASILSQKSALSKLVIQNIIKCHEFYGIKFLVVPYMLNLHWCVAVVDIPRQTITTINVHNRQTWAIYLGQAINTKLSGQRNGCWKWTAILLYPYRNGDITNYGTIMCHNIKTVVLGKPIENIPFRELWLHYLWLIVQCYKIELQSNAFLSQLSFTPSS